MTVIALPSGHDHLADALVRDLGFTRLHVDEPVRQMMLALDPFVEPGVTLANMGRSPRLSSRLATHDGDWDRAIARAPEIGRLMGVLREHSLGIVTLTDGDVVVVAVDTWPQALTVMSAASATSPMFVAIHERVPADWQIEPNHVVVEGGIVDQQTAIVDYARSLRRKRTRRSALVGAGEEPATFDDEIPDPRDDV